MEGGSKFCFFHLIHYYLMGHQEELCHVKDTLVVDPIINGVEKDASKVEHSKQSNLALGQPTSNRTNGISYSSFGNLQERALDC